MVGRAVQWIVCYPPGHAEIVKFALEPPLLAQGPLVPEARFFEHPVGGGVAGVAG
jgi:hypothetical protein